MFLVGLIVGASIGWVATTNIIGALVGAVLGVAVPFAAQYILGMRSVAAARKEVPIDLTVIVPGELTKEAYVALPLAARNGVIATLIASASSTSPEPVAGLLAGMMGRERMSNLASQRAADELIRSLDATLVVPEQFRAVSDGEILLAARSSLPPSDRVRTVVEHNLGRAVDETVMREAVETTRLPLAGGSIRDLADRAIAGDVDLAFVVGSIRKVGEYHAREIAKIR